MGDFLLVAVVQQDDDQEVLVFGLELFEVVEGGPLVHDAFQEHERFHAVFSEDVDLFLGAGHVGRETHPLLLDAEFLVKGLAEVVVEDPA